MKDLIFLLPILFICIALGGCDTKKVIIPTDGFLVSGNVCFERPRLNKSNITLSSIVDETPVPCALIEVVDTSDNNRVINVGKTDLNGDFSIIIPFDYQNSPLRVHALTVSGDNRFPVGVFIRPVNGIEVDPEDIIDSDDGNLVAGASETYFIESEVFIGTRTDLKLLATMDLVEGQPAGAFNIFSSTITSLNFIVEKGEEQGKFPALQVIWELGTTGARDCTCYYGNFFSFPDTINLQNNQQFDDSVIIHEVGHYLHDNFSDTDSPGGPHTISCSGNQVIDPRLAYSEGWANGFAQIVIGDPIYYDTRPGGGGAFDVERPCFVQRGPNSEVIVAAIFYDLYDGSENDLSSRDFDGISVPFNQLWDVFKRTRATNVNISDFFKQSTLSGIVTVNDWDDAFDSLGAGSDDLQIILFP